MSPIAALESSSLDLASSVEVLIGPDEWNSGLRRDALAGLTASPKVLPPTWLYDDLGSLLFEAITRLAEYYPTRAERAILDATASEIADLSRADTLVELGSGSSEKTRLLLDALSSTGSLRRFVPFDVAEPTLRAAADAIAYEYPDVAVTGIVGDFRRHLGALPSGGRRLVAFLGGTIGNLMPPERASMLRSLVSTMASGDRLLVGTDLVKDRRRLVRAYDDLTGVTAAFNKNVLSVLNRDLGANFDVSRFDHVARFDETHEWIEMRLRSRGPQVVDIAALGTRITFEDREDLRTEISAKFRPERVRYELCAAGLYPDAMWTDPAGDYALTLAVKP